ncbi:MAG: 50S ribosomal protein L25 [Victivallaceae bacterium]|nr:50S ribosomal protein L25 [Victivallaceae bacterium]
MSIKIHEIAFEKRNTFGDNASRRARKAGMIPAIVYSKGKESLAVSVNADKWKVVSAHAAHMVMLTCGDTKIPALVREVQHNYLKNYVLHIDFQEVDLNREIVDHVPLHIHGDAVGVAHGGIVEQELHTLEVVCRPIDLPEFIVADASKLDIGDRLTVAELVLPENVRTNVDGETVVCHVVVPREEPEAAPETEVTEPEAIKEKKADEAADGAAKDSKKSK